MRIYTITCHDCYNYGASLQAYALQKFLQYNGHDCQIIDYKPPYLDKKYKFSVLRKDERGYGLYRKLGPFKALLALYVHRKSLKNWPRKNAFDRFTRQYLRLTPTYRSNGEIANACLDGDIYIAGSDQIWNTDLKNGRDAAFYMSFAPSSKRISYAASFGISCIREPYLEFAKEQLRQIRWISVREKTGVNIVRSLGLDAVQVMDPVFLLSSEEWATLCPTDTPQEPYLLLYYLGQENPYIKILVQRIAKERNLRIYALNDGKRLSFADKNINDAGPQDFLYYFKNASYVVSTSFHATAFSILFSKQFLVCPITGQQNNSRMKDILDLFGIGDRLVLSADYPQLDIDYNQLSILLEDKVESSKKLLLSHLLDSGQ